MAMKSSQSVLLFVLVCLLVNQAKSAVQMAASYTCGPCKNTNLTCSSGKCNLIVSGNFTKEVCSEGCGAQFVVEKVGIFQCTTSYLGISCLDSLCFYRKNRTSACYYSACPSALSYSSVCSTSCSITSCQSCIKHISPTGVIQLEYCYPLGCTISIDFNTTIQACKNGKDEDGLTCSCCAKRTYQPFTHDCIVSLTKDQQVLTYTRNYLATSTDNNSTNNTNSNNTNSNSTNNSTKNSTNSGNWEDKFIAIGARLATLLAVAIIGIGGI